MRLSSKKRHLDWFAETRLGTIPLKDYQTIDFQLMT